LFILFHRQANSGAISIFMYLYVIEDSERSRVKLGYSQDPESRVGQLQTGNSSSLRLVYKAWAGDRCGVLERVLHKEFAHHRVKGEWYNMPSDRAANYVDYVIIRYLDDPLV
jgi:hypothetical protein